MKVTRDDIDFVGLQQLTFVKDNTNFAGSLLKNKPPKPHLLFFPKWRGRNGFCCCSVSFPVQPY